MAEQQPPLDNMLLGEGVKQMQEISREEILKQIFGDIGELAEVESTVLLHGRMYITNRFICFYSNLFGLEKKIRIPYSHIRSITKENTAMVIPNAIAISTDKKDYTFRSFWDREDCFRILTAFLSKFRGLTNETPAPSKLRLAALREAKAASLPGNSNNATLNPLNGAADAESIDSSSHSPGLDEQTISSRHQSLPIPRKRNLATIAALPPPGTPTVAMGGNGHGTASTPASLASTTKQDEAMDAEFETDMTLAPDKAVAGEDKAAVFAAEVAKATQKLPVVTGEILNISLKDFADLFFEENAPFSYKWYHESVKDNSLVVTPWTEMPSQLGFGREMKFFKPVNLPGLASTRGVKLQKYLRFDDIGLILCSSTRLEDVPCADSFSVEDTVVVRKVDANTVSVDITFCVLFLKSTMMKYIIERSTNGEMAKWLEVFYKHLKKTTDAKKEGKLILPGDSSAQPSTPPSAVPATPAAAPAPAATTAVTAAPASPAHTHKHKHGTGGMVEGFMSVLSFREESLGDQIKFALCLLLVLYLVVNYIRWQMITYKLENLESQLAKLEAVAQQLLAQQTKSGVPKL